MPLPGETTFDAPHVERHSRLTTFFRWLLVIPHLVVAALYGFVAYIAGVIAWFAILFTGRYPAGLYGFNAGFVRYASRVSSYSYLLADAYPPFGTGPESPYPVGLQVGPPKESYSRLSALIRIFPLIIVWVIAYVLSIVLGVVAFVAWFVVVIMGRLPRGLHDVLAFCISYQCRAMAYAFLLTESFPSFDTAGARPEAPGGAYGATPADATRTSAD
jgi:hypothetical protein